MEIVDVNVCKLDNYNMEDELYYESLWEKMFDEGKYTDDGCNEAVGFIYSNACHAEVYGNAMDVRWIKDCADKIRLAMVANDLVNNLMGTEQKKIITEENNGTTLLAESERDAKDKADDYAEVWNDWNEDTIELVSVEKQTASEG